MEDFSKMLNVKKSYLIVLLLGAGFLVHLMLMADQKIEITFETLDQDLIKSMLEASSRKAIREATLVSSSIETTTQVRGSSLPCGALR